MKISRPFLALALIASVFSSSPKNADAYTERLINGYEDKYILYSDGPGAEKKLEGGDRVGANSYVYEVPTMKALGYAYWTLGFYKPTNDYALDVFTLMNECEIYTNYYTDKLEWKKIRSATRKFIEVNKQDFPTRFEFVMPINVKDFNPDLGGIEISPVSKIDSLRRFEFYAAGAFTEICKLPVKDGYPASLIIEFSRPFTLTNVPVTKEQAEVYTTYIYDKFVKRFDISNRKRKYLEQMRVMYLVFKLKFFTYGKHMGLNERLVPTVQMMAVMEGYEIYQDVNRETLLYSQSFIANKSTGRLTVKLKDQYEILRKKSKEGGILN